MKICINPSLLSRGKGSTRLHNGAVLLEVVLALMLFVGAAIVIGGALQSSLSSVERLRYETHAGNLAATVLSEVQMGMRPLTGGGPEPFLPPFEKWTWEMTLGPAEDKFSSSTALQRAEVIIRHKENSIVYRRAQFFLPRDEEEEQTAYPGGPYRRANNSPAKSKMAEAGSPHSSTRRTHSL